MFKSHIGGGLSSTSVNGLKVIFPVDKLCLTYLPPHPYLSSRGHEFTRMHTSNFKPFHLQLFHLNTLAPCFYNSSAAHVTDLSSDGKQSEDNTYIFLERKTKDHIQQIRN